MIEPAMVGMMRQRCAGWAGGIPYGDEHSISDIDSELATAAQFVAEARRIVARQRARIVKLKMLGRTTLDQELTLEAFVSTLALLENCARELVDTARRLGSTRRMLS